MPEIFVRVVRNKRRGTGDSYVRGTEIIGLELDILGVQLEFNIDIDKDLMRLSDVVPLARTICSKIIKVALKNAHKYKKHVPCHKGCSACCSRYIVPLSVPEVFKLKEDISAVPKQFRESIWNNCLHAAQLILKQKPPKSLTQQSAKILQPNPIDLTLLSDWYSNLNIPCPFLCNGLCTIYEHRPLACREHYITGSATACSRGHAAAQVLDIPVQMPTVLGQLAGEFEDTDVEAIMLPLSLVWCDENVQRSQRTWPADLLVGRFVEIVQEMAVDHLIEYADQLG